MIVVKDQVNGIEQVAQKQAHICRVNWPFEREKQDNGKKLSKNGEQLDMHTQKKKKKMTLTETDLALFTKIN